MWVFTKEDFVQTASALAPVMVLRVRPAYLFGGKGWNI